MAQFSVSGGGKTLDTAKHWHISWCSGSDRTDYRLYRCTVQRIVVIYTDEGEFDRYLLCQITRICPLSTPKIVAGAPARLLAAGIGDALATWFESACLLS
ncbi:glycerol dehydrogenase [Escherichia coli]|uniref:Glycerol dehydrogenase n=1 Tax=Escherichia coli TaxID=562 RepID=A0A376TZY0_ECOLX|nr:glycerol dehydrogenase [Escherichia coli]